ncbi:alpha/beta fold hydrolase [Antrihabitans sp. NCIMB 15449]|uniref:Alpha/beta fold hydrolase n=1 Tax=Antrihabitans spumae TaxID=3373370 RepID=A0ABW7JVV5_9NOCA
MTLALVAPQTDTNRFSDAVANAGSILLYHGVADLRRSPRTLIDLGPQRAVYRYQPTAEVRSGPVLLVPPLAVADTCFDLRRGCSLVSHLVDGGRATYVVDYGRISFDDRRLGMEHWIDDVLPAAIRAVSADAGGQPVHLVSWSLGGVFCLLTAAEHADLPIASITPIASPVDFHAVPMAAPLLPVAKLTGGAILTQLTRLLGGAPKPMVQRAFQLSSVTRYLTKPLTLATNLHDRDFLAQMEAVDEFTRNMTAYPARTFGQSYQRLFRHNDLADGTLVLSAGRIIRLADVTVPVLVVAGKGDTIAPLASVNRVVDLLTGSPRVRSRVAPGGHLGVLTGRAAQTSTWAYLDEFLDEV